MPISIHDIIVSKRPFYTSEKIKALRRKHSITQAQLAAVLNIPIDTLRNWERDRVSPSGPAHRLLEIFEKNPRSFL